MDCVCVAIANTWNLWSTRPLPFIALITLFIKHAVLHSQKCLSIQLLEALSTVASDVLWCMSVLLQTGKACRGQKTTEARLQKI